MLKKDIIEEMITLHEVIDSGLVDINSIEYYAALKRYKELVETATGTSLPNASSRSVYDRTKHLMS